MKPIKFSLFIFFISVITLVSCSDDTTVNQQNMLGTWISIDKKDTLDFVDNSNFYKNKDHYNYELSGDSIEVKYSGMLIYIASTKHKYWLKDDALIIDFSNKLCYGFDLQKMTFLRSGLLVAKRNNVH